MIEEPIGRTPANRQAAPFDETALEEVIRRVLARNDQGERTPSVPLFGLSYGHCRLNKSGSPLVFSESLDTTGLLHVRR